MFIYNKLVLDGNDGTGKTTRANAIREIMGIEVNERGPLSRLTDCDELFGLFSYKKEPIGYSETAIDAMDEMKRNTDTLYVILDSPVKTCQQNIISRGGSIEEKYHTFEDLCYYRERFRMLYDFLKKELKMPNVFFLETKAVWIDCVLIKNEMTKNEKNMGMEFFEYYEKQKKAWANRAKQQEIQP